MSRRVDEVIAKVILNTKLCSKFERRNTDSSLIGFNHSNSECENSHK